MHTKPKFFISMLLAVTILLVNFGGMTGVANAAPVPVTDELIITVTPVIECGAVEYTISWTGGSPPYHYHFFMDYGDGDTTGLLPLNVESDRIILNHPYTDPGDYEWIVRVEEVDGDLVGSTVGIITIDGPTVTLYSDPFPPLIILGDSVIFSATVTGGKPDYVYAWDLGDGSGTGDTASLLPYTYTAAGKYQAEVMVTDSCEFTSTATLPVVVVNPGDICHPTAQKISDAVNLIFPNQADDLYTCEDIYDIFNGSLTGDQLGFGRMWKAYNLTQTIEELTWEEIRDWHLDTGGWGALLQLDRFSDLLAYHSIGDLMALVMSEEYSLADVRTAARSVTRYEADFEDALSRIAAGANAGELGQLYKLAADLGADLAILDGYLADGLTLSELKHTANFADRMEVDWTEIAEFRASADSWGDIKQAYNLATEDGISVAEILILSVQEYRKDLQEAAKEGRQVELAIQQEEKNKQTAEKLAEQFSPDSAYVMSLFTEGECEGNWGCVRKVLREEEKAQAEGLSDRGRQTALQIASKYGVFEIDVIDYYENENLCDGDWACTRAHFRELYMDTNVKGKPDNPGKPKK